MAEDTWPQEDVLRMVIAGKNTAEEVEDALRIQGVQVTLEEVEKALESLAKEGKIVEREQGCYYYCRG